MAITESIPPVANITQSVLDAGMRKTKWRFLVNIFSISESILSFSNFFLDINREISSGDFARGLSGFGSIVDFISLKL